MSLFDRLRAKDALPHPLYHLMRDGELLGQVASDGSGRRAVTLFTSRDAAEAFCRERGGQIYALSTMRDLRRLAGMCAAAEEPVADVCLDPPQQPLYTTVADMLAWGRKRTTERPLPAPLGVALGPDGVPTGELTAAGRVVVLFRTPDYGRRWLTTRSKRAELAVLESVEDCERFVGDWSGYFAAYTIDPPLSVYASLDAYPLERLVELAYAETGS